MTKEEVKKIGSRQGLFAAGAGLLVAQLIMAFVISADKGFVKGFFWFAEVDFKMNIAIGAAIMLLCSHFYGRVAAWQIMIKKRHFIVVGILCGICVLLTTAFLSGWVGFFREGIANSGRDDNPFYDYIFKPFYWVALFGIIPASLLGIWFGMQVKRRWEK